MLKEDSSQPVGNSLDNCSFYFHFRSVCNKRSYSFKIQLRATQRYIPTTFYEKFRIPVGHATYKERFAVTVSSKACVRCNKLSVDNSQNIFVKSAKCHLWITDLRANQT